ncbi:PREDICTED: lipoma-preferred partner homolog isoform X2 [Priapulus caudatus]|uniref:Lipoma-preferred partner homolog isoform X2 n=1 Tax=Priapulus caudatus TaxID=37621 RepID=A0ABM1ETB0_PRICU|nr:PREDICTED: lipoma-preferred partner homolog isoform X2 [Priapulus caudatus]
MSTTQQRLERQFGQLEVSGRQGADGQATAVPYATKKAGPMVPPKPKYAPHSATVTIQTAQMQSHRGPSGSPMASTTTSHRTIHYAQDSDDDLPPPPPPQAYSNYSVNDGFPPPPSDLPPPPSPPSAQMGRVYPGAQPTYGSQQPTVRSPSPVIVKKRGYPTPYVPPSQQQQQPQQQQQQPQQQQPQQQQQQQQQQMYRSVTPTSPPATAPKPSLQAVAAPVGAPVGAPPVRHGKEAELDALTNLLVQSMDSGNDPDFFGVCAKCGKKIQGDGTGCSAMDQMFHIGCFTCTICAKKLRGVPFYAVEGKPYCEDDYFNTLEKCSICSKPIMDRILRATGKPYHPGCFTCVVCGKSLDGIPFTVDATNQIHCIEDFHRKFAPRCAMCHQPIMPEQGQEETVRIVALDKSFHINCYRCEDCGCQLSSEADGRGCYPLDDHILCRQCNAARINALTSRMTTEL